MLVVYGTETGTAKQGITKIAKRLGANGSTEIVGTVDGNSVGNLKDLKDKCDVLLVATSSFGEGDPPGNYGKFLVNLLQGASAGDMPLEGVAHAVLGYGSSVYDTYQNCPRLSDKLLGECGSRRLARRAEIDEIEDSEDQADKLKKWEAAVTDALKKPAPKTAKSVCDWTEPASQILEKAVGDISAFDVEGGGASGMAAAALLAVVAAAAGAYYAGWF